jgi:hypothetical protein
MKNNCKCNTQNSADIKDVCCTCPDSYRDCECSTTILWSILIPTIVERKESFNYLVTGLYNQINVLGLQDVIEIVSIADSIKDKDKMSIGMKRNDLIEQAQGKYISFIDDDDDVSHDYVRIIYNELKKNVDVLGITGIITINGRKKTAKKFIHSSKYKSYFENRGVYYRCPNHLNPMRKSIAQQVTFVNKSHGEDTDWALELSKLNLFTKELLIEKPIYFYKYQIKPVWK